MDQLLTKQNSKEWSSEFLPERLPPQNVEAEQSVLGSLMIDKEAIGKVADILRPRDFYRDIHGTIYEAMLYLYEKSEPIDFLSISNRLEEIGKLDGIGGASYLSSLVSAVPTAAHVSYYAEIVKRKKVLRDLISAAHHITSLGYQEERDVDELLDEAEKKVFSISQESLRQEFTPLKDDLAEAFARLERLHSDDKKLRGVPTGFYDMDNLLAGLQKSDLIILAARPSLGKTSLALDIARNIACREKQTVGIFSLEMSKEQVVDRLIAAEADVDLWRIRTGKIPKDDEHDFRKIREALDALANSPIFVDDAPFVNTLQMKTMARRLQAEHGLALLIVDYLQLMEPRRHTDSMVQQVTEISRSLKGLARELSVPVLALSQLSRATEQRPDQIPRLSDLRESGSLEQDSDVVMFIYREDKVKQGTDRKNIADILVSKHRNGPTGKVELYFNEQTVSFKNLERYFTE